MSRLASNCLGLPNIWNYRNVPLCMVQIPLFSVVGAKPSLTQHPTTASPSNHHHHPLPPSFGSSLIVPAPPCSPQRLHPSQGWPLPGVREHRRKAVRLHGELAACTPKSEPCRIVSQIKWPSGRSFPAQDTYPVSINNELKDIAGISGQNPHCGPWDELTIVLERKVKISRAY